MNRRLAILLATLSLLVGTFAAPAAVAATGNCSEASVVFTSLANGTGTSVRFCQGANDSDIEGENIPATTMGPLSDGSLRPDFDTSHTTSGVSYLSFVDATGGVDYRLCLYSGKAYVGLMVSITSTGSLNLTGGLDNIAGSFKIATSC